MEGFANLVSMMDYVLDTKRKRHITGGLLLSAAMLFGGLANRVISFKRASGLISRLGQLRKCNSQKILERFYQPKTMFDLKKVVRRECRRLQALYPPYVAA